MTQQQLGRLGHPLAAQKFDAYIGASMILSRFAAGFRVIDKTLSRQALAWPVPAGIRTDSADRLR